jgi:transposase
VSILSQHEEAILEIVETNPDFTLREYCEAVQEKLGVSSNTSMMDRFLKQHDISLKKNIQERKSNHGGSTSRARELLAENFESGS